jgi:hypothetical protein
VYTPKMLRASLESAGFVEVKEFVPRGCATQK